MTLSRNRIERRNGINDEEPADLRSSTWRTKHIGLEGIRGLTRLLCIFPGYLTVPFFAQVYMVTSKLSVNYLKFSFKSILIKCTIRLRPKIALLRLWVYGGRGNVESSLLCPWVRPSVRPYTCKRCYSDSFEKMAESKFPSCLYDPLLLSTSSFHSLNLG